MEETAFHDIDINFDRLKESDKENDFMSTSVALSNELKMNIAKLLYVKEQDSNEDAVLLTRNKAIIYGLIMRSLKVFQSYSELICEGRGETAKILLRSFIETIVNAQYLIRKNSDKLFDEFVRYSLRTEKKLYDTVKDNIGERGEKLPIEKRILKSVCRAFESSGIEPGDIDAKESYRGNKWGSISLQKKCIELYSENIYQGVFELMHHSVHGNWQSLLSEDLIYDEEKGMFTLQYKHSAPRPQHILVAMILYCDMAKEFIEYLDISKDIKKFLHNIFSHTREKIERVDSLHEDFLQKRR